MIKEEKIVVEKTIRHKYCDLCNTETSIGLVCSKAQCEICKRDLCEKCIGYEDTTWGDYRTVYCKDCWNSEYRIKLDVLKNKIDNLYNQWYEDCEKFKIK